jgi:hypothetical protein
MSIKDNILNSISNFLGKPETQQQEQPQTQPTNNEEKEVIVAGDAGVFNGEGEPIMSATPPKPQPKEFLINGNIKKANEK